MRGARLVYLNIYTTTFVRTHLTGKVSKHIYAPDQGPKLPSSVISDLGPEHKYASIPYRSNPFSQLH